MDSLYIEPFGLFFGGTFTLLQILDFVDVAKMPWNSGGAFPDDKEIGEQVGQFFSGNIGGMAGFSAGYFLGNNFLNWTDFSSEEAVEDL